MNAPRKTSRRQWQRQRHAHDRQAGADTDRVDQRDEKGCAHIADQRSEAGPAGFAHPLLHVRREDLGDELPDVAAAVQEEDQGEQHQQRAGDDFGDGRRRRQRTAGQLRLVVLQRLDRGVARVVDLFLGQVRRPFDQPGSRGVNALGDLVDETGQAGDELGNDEREDAPDDRHSGQQDQRHRAAAGGAAPVEEVDGGDQQCGEDHRQRDGDHDQFEGLDHPEHREDEREDDQQSPGPRRRLADERLDRRVGNRVNRGASRHAGSVTAGRRACVGNNVPDTRTATL